MGELIARKALDDSVWTSADSPWIYVLDCAPEEAARLETLIPQSFILRYLLGSRMSTVEGVFSEIAASLQFPWYFGRNWGAFDDSMRDPYWTRSMRGDGYVVVVWSGDSVLAGLGQELTALMEHLSFAAREMAEGQEWSESYIEPGRPMHFVFQVERDRSEAFVRRLEGASVEFALLELPTTTSTG